MASVTLSARKDYAVGSVPAIPAVPKKRFLARLYDAIVAAQTAKAERALDHYLRRTGQEPRA